MKISGKRLILILTFVFLLSLSSCARVIGPDYDAQLADTEWILSAYGEEDVPTQVIEGTTVTLQFKPDGLVGGSGGCNVYSTKCEVTDGTITFKDVESTLMACLEENITAQESIYFSALRTAIRYERSGDELRIWYGDGERVLSFDIIQTP